MNELVKMSEEILFGKGLPDFSDILRPILDQSAHRNAMARSLASIVTDLLNKHEPLLKAECEGHEITVSEKGGPLVFTITVEPQSPRESVLPNKRADLMK